MNTTKISIIAAIGAQNRAIGKDNDLIWHIPKDLKRFKDITNGHPVIMGRKTWESIPEKYRPLPNRDNFVITRNQDYLAPSATVATSLEIAIELAKDNASDEIFIIGGASIYKQALPFADTLYLTLVEGGFDGDTFFPEYKHLFTEVSSESSEENGISFSFVELKKAE